MREARRAGCAAATGVPPRIGRRVPAGATAGEQHSRVLAGAVAQLGSRSPRARHRGRVQRVGGRTPKRFRGEAGAPQQGQHHTDVLRLAVMRGAHDGELAGGKVSRDRLQADGGLDRLHARPGEHRAGGLPRRCHRPPEPVADRDVAQVHRLLEPGADHARELNRWLHRGSVPASRGRLEARPQALAGNRPGLRIAAGLGRLHVGVIARGDHEVLLLHEDEELVHHVGIELRSGRVLDLPQRPLRRERAPVGPVARHRVEGVGHREDPSRERNVPPSGRAGSRLHRLARDGGG